MRSSTQTFQMPVIRYLPRLAMLNIAIRVWIFCLCIHTGPNLLYSFRQIVRQTWRVLSGIIVCILAVCALVRRCRVKVLFSSGRKIKKIIRTPSDRRDRAERSQNAEIRGVNWVVKRRDGQSKYDFVRCNVLNIVVDWTIEQLSLVFVAVASFLSTRNYTYRSELTY